MISSLPSHIIRTQRLILAAFYGLLAYFAVATTMALGGVPLAWPVVYLIQAIALLVFIPAIHRAHIRTHVWLSLVALLYFTHGIMVAFDPARLWLGVTETLLTSALYCALMVFIIQYRRHYGLSLKG